MTDMHPGGAALTERLLAIADIGSFNGLRLLDMGCGSCASKPIADMFGVDWTGIDISPAQPRIVRADMKELPFDSGAFDIVLAECSVLISGSVKRSLGEAFRVLKNGGTLLLSDVFFDEKNAPDLAQGMPATLENWIGIVRNTGFSVVAYSDETPLWKEFYLRALWEGRKLYPVGFAVKKGAKPGYFIMSCKKP